MERFHAGRLRPPTWQEPRGCLSLLTIHSYIEPQLSPPTTSFGWLATDEDAGTTWFATGPGPAP